MKTRAQHPHTQQGQKRSRHAPRSVSASEAPKGSMVPASQQAKQHSVVVRGGPNCAQPTEWLIIPKHAGATTNRIRIVSSGIGLRCGASGDGPGESNRCSGQAESPDLHGGAPGLALGSPLQSEK